MLADFFFFEGKEINNKILGFFLNLLQIGIDIHKFEKGFTNDLEFVQRLMAEESVFCLPGEVSTQGQSSMTCCIKHCYRLTKHSKDYYFESTTIAK